MSKTEQFILDAYKYAEETNNPNVYRIISSHVVDEFEEFERKNKINKFIANCEKILGSGYFEQAIQEDSEKLHGFLDNLMNSFM